MDFGYTREEVIDMTMKLPSIYEFNIDNLRMKKEFYDMIGISDIFLVSTVDLMQGIDLSYARYMFCKSIGLEINMSNYRVLFISKKQFESKFGIKNDMLLELYSYSEYLENKDSKKMELK